MSKQETLNQQKKELSPVLKAFLIPIMYFALTLIMDVAFCLLYIVKALAQCAIYLIAHPIDFGEYFQEILARRLNYHVPYYLVKALIEMTNNQPVLLMISALLSLIVILFVLRKRYHLSELFAPNQDLRKINLSAILIGLGIGGLLVGCNALSEAFMTKFSETALNDLLYDLQEYFSANFVVIQKLGWHASFSDTLIGFLLRALYTGSFYQIPQLSIFIINTVLHAIICTLIFGLGFSGNLMKKMPAIRIAILSALLYAFLGNSGTNLLFALIIGLFLSIFYIKSQSVIPTVIFSLSIGLSNVLGLATKLLLGSYSSRYADNVSPFWEIGLYRSCDFGFTNDIAMYFYIACLIGAAILSIPLLIIGIILLCKIGKSKKSNQCQPDISRQ